MKVLKFEIKKEGNEGSLGLSNGHDEKIVWPPLGLAFEPFLCKCAVVKEAEYSHVEYRGKTMEIAQELHGLKPEYGGKIKGGNIFPG